MLYLHLTVVVPGPGVPFSTVKEHSDPLRRPRPHPFPTKRLVYNTLPKMSEPPLCHK